MSLSQFQLFAKDIGIMQGGHMTSVKDVDGTKLIRPIVPAEIAIIFVSANNSGPKQGSFFNGPDATIDDNGGSFMVMYEFAYALSRLAFECFPQFPSIVDRAQSFVERIIVPGVGHMLDPVSALLDWLFSRRTAAVFDYHDELMRDIFACYAKSDDGEKLWILELLLAAISLV